MKIRRGRTFGDYTSEFFVYLEKEYTVEEFIKEIFLLYKLNRGELKIKDNNKKEIKTYRYSENVIKDDIIDKNILSQKIKWVDAHGCYSLMNYTIYLV